MTFEFGKSIGCAEVGCHQPLSYDVSCVVDGNPSVIGFCYQHYWQFRSSIADIPGTLVRRWSNGIQQVIEVDSIEEV